MSEVLYTMLEYNEAKTHIMGVWCDGVWFATHPPLVATPVNEKWVRNEIARIAEEYEATQKWRRNASNLAWREEAQDFRRRQYQFELRQEQYIKAAYEHLVESARKELKAENDKLINLWFKAADFKYKGCVQDHKRDRQIAVEFFFNKKTYKEIARMFEIHPSRVGQILDRARRRHRLYWEFGGYRDHEAEGQIQPPPAEDADHGEGVEWTPEAQHREFELMRQYGTA